MTFPALSQPAVSHRSLLVTPEETAARAEAEVMSPPLALTLLRCMQLAGLFRDRSHFLRKHHNVATGIGIIDFLIAHGWAHDRDHGRRIGTELIGARMIVHAVRKRDDFKDKQHSFYRVTDRIGFKEAGVAARLLGAAGMGRHNKSDEAPETKNTLASMRKTKL